MKFSSLKERTVLIWLLAGGLFTLLLLLWPFPRTGRLIKTLMDLGHGPLFAVLAGVACWAVPESPSSRRRAMGIWFWLAVFGLLTEWVQQWVGRQSSWEDASANLLGATAGVLWSESRFALQGRLAFRGLAILCLLLAMAQPAWKLGDALYQVWQMPVLASFETPGEISRWALQNCQVKRVRNFSTHGEWALQVDLAPTRYAGLALNEVPPDWTGYRELALDVTLETPHPLPWIIKITDQAHNWKTEDRFESQVTLDPGRNVIRIPLREVEQAPRNRRMELSRMRMLQLFTVQPAEPVRLYLDHLRLLPADPAEDTTRPELPRAE